MEQTRPVRESQAEVAEMMLPNDANPLGNILGGKVMHLVDVTAAIAAARHSRGFVVTASVDHMDFRNPVHVGELLILEASVNRAFTTSMEVGVKVQAENLATGQRRQTSSAFVTFVAIDGQGRPRPVPPVIPETEEEKRRYEQAEERRIQRLEHRTRHR